MIAGRTMIWWRAVLAWGWLSCVQAHASPGFDARPWLADIARRAVERSAQAGQLRAEVTAAGMDLEEAKGRRWPQVDVGVQSTLKSGFSGPSYSGDPSARPAATLTISTTLFDWGRTEKLIDARDKTREAAGYKLELAIDAVALDACIQVARIARQRRLLVITDEYVRRMGALVDMLAEIVMVDRGRASELTQARARLLQAQATRDVVVARLREAGIALRRLIGKADVVVPEGDWQLAPSAVEPLLDAVEQHPAVRQAEADAQAAGRNAESLEASALPALNLAVSRASGSDPYGRAQNWQVMVSVSMPLSHGGSITAAVGAARERMRASQLHRQQVLEDQQFAIRSAQHDGQAALERARAFEGLSIELERVRNIFYDQWLHLGRRSLLDVLNAESEHYNNQSNALSSLYDAYESTLKSYDGAGTLVSWLRAPSGTQ